MAFLLYYAFSVVLDPELQEYKVPDMSDISGLTDISWFDEPMDDGDSMMWPSDHSMPQWYRQWQYKKNYSDQRDRRAVITFPRAPAVPLVCVVAASNERGEWCPVTGSCNYHVAGR